MISSDAPDWGRWDYRAWRESPVVQLMTWKERGLYQQLLDIQWRLGYVPASAMSCARIIGVQFPEWEEFETTFKAVLEWEVFHTLEDDPSKMVNPRQVKERTRAIHYFEQKRQAGKSNKGRHKERTLRRTSKRAPNVRPNAPPIDVDVDKETLSPSNEVESVVARAREAPPPESSYPHFDQLAAYLNGHSDAARRFAESADHPRQWARAIMGLYGPHGTDALVWGRTPEDARPGLLAIALDRCAGEGTRYRGHFFRAVLAKVIEQCPDELEAGGLSPADRKLLEFRARLENIPLGEAS